MNDPHLESLHYALEAGEACEYEAPPLSVTLPGFKGRLEGLSLTLWPEDHYASADPARALLEPYLQAWRISAGLQHGRDDFRLSFSKATVIDRKPTPNTGAIVLNSLLSISGAGHMKAVRREYPEPPRDFTASPEAQALWERFSAYLAGREPLLSMAYFCVTLLERPDRRAAATHYNIHFDILNKLGELTSTRGDATTARKASPSAPLSDAERTWIEAALKALIIHLGGQRASKLTMAQLPAL